MSYGGSGNPDEELRLKVVYDASPAVKQATDDLRDLKKETSALEAVMGTLDAKVEETGAAFTEFYSNPIPATVTELNILRTTVETTAGEGAAATATGGGFAALTKNAFMAERALTALATGHGIARVGPMLEKIIGAAGGPAGIGFGIAGLAYLLETIGPKVEGFLKSWAEASGIIDATANVKTLADELERALKASEALDKTPTVQAAKTKAAVSAAVTARGGENITGQIELGLAKTTQLEEYMTPQELERYQALPKEGLTPEFVQAEQEKILVKARAKRHERASAWKGQLETDKGSRQGLQQLAKAAPGIISPLFLDELAMAEPEAQVEVEQQKRAEAAAGKELHTGWGQKRKEEIKRDKAFAHDVGVSQRVSDQMEREEAADRKKDDDLARSYDEWAIRENNAAQNKATRDHDKAARAKAQHDKQAARENTMAHRMHAAVQQQHEQVAGYVGAANQQYGFARTPGQLEEVTRGATANVNMGMDIASAVQMAVQATEAKIQRDFMRGMQRSFSGGEMRGQ